MEEVPGQRGAFSLPLLRRALQSAASSEVGTMAAQQDSTAGDLTTTRRHISAAAARSLGADVVSWLLEALFCAHVQPRWLTFEDAHGRVHGLELFEKFEAKLRALGLSEFQQAMYTCPLASDAQAHLVYGNTDEARSLMVTRGRYEKLQQSAHDGALIAQYRASDAGAALVRDGEPVPVREWPVVPAWIERDLAAQTRAIDFCVAQLRIEVLINMMGRLVDRHLKDIKAWLWRPGGRLVARRAQHAAREALQAASRDAAGAANCAADTLASTLVISK